MAKLASEKRTRRLQLEQQRAFNQSAKRWTELDDQAKAQSAEEMKQQEELQMMLQEEMEEIAELEALIAEEEKLTEPREISPGEDDEKEVVVGDEEIWIDVD